MAEIVARKERATPRFTPAPRDPAKSSRRRVPSRSTAPRSPSTRWKARASTCFDPPPADCRLPGASAIVGDRVNLEIDTMACYAARLVEAAKEGL
jgi:riboflavin synthase